MTELNERWEQRLGRLAEATEGVRPRPTFEDRVMQAIDAEAQPQPSLVGADWFAGLVRVGRLVLATAAVTAAAAVAFAVQSQQAYDQEAAVAYVTMEIGW